MHFADAVEELFARDGAAAEVIDEDREREWGATVEGDVEDATGGDALERGAETGRLEVGFEDFAVGLGEEEIGGVEAR